MHHRRSQHHARSAHLVPQGTHHSKKYLLSVDKRDFFVGDPDGIRTRVTAVKGRCLRPLDHRAEVVAVVGLEPTTLRV